MVWMCAVGSAFLSIRYVREACLEYVINMRTRWQAQVEAGMPDVN
jgi:hypothetical protein